jgi:hypothetical protein
VSLTLVTCITSPKLGIKIPKLDSSVLIGVASKAGSKIRNV